MYVCVYVCICCIKKTDRKMHIMDGKRFYYFIPPKGFDRVV